MIVRCIFCDRLDNYQHEYGRCTNIPPKSLGELIEHDFKDFCKKYRKAKEETVPSGQEQLLGGVKHDESKRRMDLVPTSLMSGVARILEFGAKKYGDNNWRQGLKWSRVYAALQRHLADFWEGNDLDSESGLPHLYHAACNIAFLIEFYEKRKDLDDRYKKKETYEAKVFYRNSKTGEQMEVKPGRMHPVENAADWELKK